jgi:hypothetical protein
VSQFKKGDLVRCINAGVCRGVDANPALTEGSVYTVQHCGEESVCLEYHVMWGYFPQRFELVYRAGPRAVEPKNRCEVGTFPFLNPGRGRV